MFCVQGARVCPTRRRQRTERHRVRAARVRLGGCQAAGPGGGQRRTRREYGQIKRRGRSRPKGRRQAVTRVVQGGRRALEKVARFRRIR